MDSLITAAARALAQGDRLGALKRVALRGIAMAQLGDFRSDADFPLLIPPEHGRSRHHH